MKYSVVWEEPAERRLADLWRLNPALRADISAASDAIDLDLHDNPLTVGEPFSLRWRQIVRPPLAALFSVIEGDRLVRVVHVKFWDE